MIEKTFILITVSSNRRLVSQPNPHLHTHTFTHICTPTLMKALPSPPASPQHITPFTQADATFFSPFSLWKRRSGELKRRSWQEKELRISGQTNKGRKETTQVRLVKPNYFVYKKKKKTPIFFFVTCCFPICCLTARERTAKKKKTELREG